MSRAAAHIHSASDARRLAKRQLPWMIFDYIDGAAGEETGLCAIEQRWMAQLASAYSTRCERAFTLYLPVWQTRQRPFGIAPMGMCNLSGVGADLMLARLAAKYEVPHGVSTVASTPMEKIIEVAEGHAWFQLYFSGDGVGTLNWWNVRKRLVTKRWF